jgi:hypothetical protein
MVLDKNFKEFIALLNVHNVKYLVIGATQSIFMVIQDTQRILIFGFG